jgi:hypothetical protein
MNVGGAINAAGKQGIIYLKTATDRFLKSAGSGKMCGPSWDGGFQRQNKSSQRVMYYDNPLMHIF